MATSSAMMGGRMTENMADHDLKEPKMSRPLLLQSRPQSCTGSSIPARSATGGRQEGAAEDEDEALQRTADDWRPRRRERTDGTARARDRQQAGAAAATGSCSPSHDSGWTGGDEDGRLLLLLRRAGGRTAALDGRQGGGSAGRTAGRRRRCCCCATGEFRRRLGPLDLRAGKPNRGPAALDLRPG